MGKRKIINAYCPVCMKKKREKLLFRYESTAKGTVIAFCKNCRQEVSIELGKK